MRLLFFIFLLLACFQAQADGPKPDTVSKKVVVHVDSARVEARVLDKKKLEIYRGQKDFIYDDTPDLNLNWWEKFWKWVGTLIDKILDNKISGSFIKYAVILILIGVTVFVVLKVIGADLKIFAKKSKEIDVPYHESDDNIHEINFDEQIQNAISNSNYRLAVRLLYLQSLKGLSDKNLIHWLPEKTNESYISEISDPLRKDEFSKLTRKFEYVWYGEFFIDKENFSNIKRSFEQFNPYSS